MHTIYSQKNKARCMNLSFFKKEVQLYWYYTSVFVYKFDGVFFNYHRRIRILIIFQKRSKSPKTSLHEKFIIKCIFTKAAFQKQACHTLADENKRRESTFGRNGSCAVADGLLGLH